MNDESKKLNFVEDSNVYILGEFDESISSDVVPALNKLIDTLDDLASSKNNTITFYINTSGGNVNELYNLLALIDIAKQKNIKIKTVVTSDAFSCASLLAIHGDERLIYKFGTHLLHLGCVSTSVCTFTQLKRNEKFIKEHFENIVKMYVENTKIPEEKVRELLIDDTCFLNANECKEMGLVDKIIGEKEE